MRPLLGVSQALQSSACHVVYRPLGALEQGTQPVINSQCHSVIFLTCFQPQPCCVLSHYHLHTAMLTIILRYPCGTILLYYSGNHDGILPIVFLQVSVELMESLI